MIRTSKPSSIGAWDRGTVETSGGVQNNICCEQVNVCTDDSDSEREGVTTITQMKRRNFEKNGAQQRPKRQKITNMKYVLSI